MLSEDVYCTLERNFHRLVESIHIDETLWSLLRSKHIVTAAQQETLSYNKAPREVVHDLINFLQKQTDNKFYAFCQCLEKSNQKHIVDHILIPKRNESFRNDVFSSDTCHQYFEGYLQCLKEYNNELAVQHFTDAPYIETMVYIGQERLHGIRRQNPGINEYNVPETISRLPRFEIKPSHLFKCLKDIGERRDPRRVLLVGVPGMGKTTMCYKLLQDMLNNGLFRTNERPAIPFFLKFRETNLLSDPVSVKELLLESNGPGYGYEEDWQSKVWKHLKENEGNIVILLDGFDECSGFEEKHKALTNNEHKKFPVQQVMYSLIAGRVLPKCHLFLTSRPHTIHKLRKEGREVVQRFVELEGFYPSKLKELIRDNLEKDFPTLCKTFLEYIDNHFSICTLCYVPRHAVCLIEFVKDKHEVDQPLQVNLMPKSIAGLLLHVVIKLLETSCKEFKKAEEITDRMILNEKRDTLHKLMDLAFEGLFGQSGLKMLFTNEDIDKFDLNTDDLGSGIIGGYRLPTKDMSGKRDLYHHCFPHLTVQELLASAKLPMLPSETLVSMACNLKGIHRMAWLLFFGLCCDKSIKEYLHNIYSGCNVEVQRFPYYAFEVLESYINSANVLYNEDILFCLHAMNECQDWGLSRSLAPWLMLRDTSTQQMGITCHTIGDGAALASFLSHMKQPLDIQLNTTYLDYILQHKAAKGFKCLVGNWLRQETVDVITESLNREVPLQQLIVSFVGAVYFRITRPCPLQRLRIRAEASYGTSNVMNTVQSFCESIQYLSSLESLEMTNMDMEPLLALNSEGVPVLYSLKALKHLKLYLMDTQHLVPVLQAAQSMGLEYLGLDHSFDGKDIITIADFLNGEKCTLKMLEVSNSCMEKAECQQLCSSSGTGSTLQILHFRGSKCIRDAMLHVESNINEIYLSDCDHVSVYGPSLRVISLCLSEMKKFPTDVLVSTVVGNPCLECLLLLGFDLSTAQLQALTLYLQQNPQSSLKVLDVSFNKDLTNSSISELIASTKLEALNIWRCNLGFDDLQLIAKAICKSPSLRIFAIGREYIHDTLTKKKWITANQAFLHTVAEQYPSDGPLQALFIDEYLDKDVVKSAAVKLERSLQRRKKLIHVGNQFEVALMKEGYFFRCLSYDAQAFLCSPT